MQNISPVELFRFSKIFSDTLVCPPCGEHIATELLINSSRERFCYRMPCGHLVHTSCVLATIRENTELNCCECRRVIDRDHLQEDLKIEQDVKNYMFLKCFDEKQEFCRYCRRFVSKFVDNCVFVPEEKCRHPRVILGDEEIKNYVTIPKFVTIEEAKVILERLNQVKSACEANINIGEDQQKIIIDRTDKTSESLKRDASREIGKLQEKIKELEEKLAEELEIVNKVSLENINYVEGKMKEDKLDLETIDSIILSLGKSVCSGIPILLDIEYLRRLCETKVKQRKVNNSFYMFVDKRGNVFYGNVIISDYHAPLSYSINDQMAMYRFSEGIIEKKDDDIFLVSRGETKLLYDKRFLPCSRQSWFSIGNHMFICEKYEPGKILISLCGNELKPLFGKVREIIEENRYHITDIFSNCLAFAKINENILEIEKYDLSGSFEKKTIKFDLPRNFPTIFLKFDPFAPASARKDTISIFDERGVVDPIILLPVQINRASGALSFDTVDMSGERRTIHVAREADRFISNYDVLRSDAEIYNNIIYFGVYMQASDLRSLEFYSFKRGGRELVFIDKLKIEYPGYYDEKYGFYVDGNEMLHINFPQNTFFVEISC